MNNSSIPHSHGDVAPGDELGPADVPQAIRGYLLGSSFFYGFNGAFFLCHRGDLPRFFKCLRHFLKSLEIRLLAKQAQPAIGPIEHMIGVASDDRSCTAWHGRNLQNLVQVCSPLALLPSFWASSRHGGAFG